MAMTWLVTWEWCGEERKPAEKVAAILDYRLSSDRIQRIVELLYANSHYTLRERLQYAKKRFDPYPARCLDWQGEIECGHNPYLYARIVTHLHVRTSKDGSERLVWRERSRSEIFSRLKSLRG
jgi:hypothetical protein